MCITFGSDKTAPIVFLIWNFHLYIDHGESYLVDDSQEESIEGNAFKAYIFAE
jgi:hypothetical protein